MRTIGLLLPLALLAGCATTMSGAGSDAGDGPEIAIADTSWQIATVDGEQATGQRTPTMQFSDSRVSGSSGCNSYGGGYTRSGNELAIGPVMSTKMACIGDGMQTETRLFAALQGTLTLSQTAPDELTLSGSDHSITLTRAR